MPLTISKILDQDGVWASAPCRIDAGGTWDIKAMALPFEPHRPTTVNIALDLRTTVRILPFEHGWLRAEVKGMGKPQISKTDQPHLRGPNALVFAALSHFDLDGASVVIEPTAPLRSSLGGSSTALVALLKAISKCMRKAGQKALTTNQIHLLAYHLEDAISGGNCGLQDQAAAVYGGVNQWVWQYRDPKGPFKRIRLLSPSGEKELSRHLLVVYTGTQHFSSTINKKWVEDFLSGKTRSGWLEVNEIVHEFAARLKHLDWAGAGASLRKEMEIREKITPEALTKLSRTLIGQAKGLGCGARFAGAGAGGCVWAIGEANNISRLEKLWSASLQGVKGGRMLKCAVDGRGVK